MILRSGTCELLERLHAETLNLKHLTLKKIDYVTKEEGKKIGVKDGIKAIWEIVYFNVVAR